MPSALTEIVPARPSVRPNYAGSTISHAVAPMSTKKLVIAAKAKPCSTRSMKAFPARRVASIKQQLDTADVHDFLLSTFSTGQRHPTSDVPLPLITEGYFAAALLFRQVPANLMEIMGLKGGRLNLDW
jgi:hypothetical protein